MFTRGGDGGVTTGGEVCPDEPEPESGLAVGEAVGAAVGFPVGVAVAGAVGSGVAGRVGAGVGVGLGVAPPSPVSIVTFVDDAGDVRPSSSVALADNVWVPSGSGVSGVHDHAPPASAIARHNSPPGPSTTTTTPGSAAPDTSTAPYGLTDPFAGVWMTGAAGPLSGPLSGRPRASGTLALLGIGASGATPDDTGDRSGDGVAAWGEC